MTSNEIFLAGTAFGLFLAPLAKLAVLEARFQVERWKLKVLTSEKRLEQNRRIRLVLRNSVSTPVPFQPVRGGKVV